MLMARTRCTVCESTHASAINDHLGAGESVRSVAQVFEISRSTLGRHAAHANVDRPTPTEPTGPPAGAGRHQAVAQALVAAFQRQRGSKFNEQDAAEAVQLQSV